MKKNRRQFSHLMGNIFFIILFLMACTPERDDYVKERIRVIVKQVNRIDIDNAVSVSGSIEPEKTVKFGFMVAGKVREVCVNEGDYVKKRQKIAALDPTDYEHGLQIAEAKYREVKSEYERLAGMYKKGSLTESDYDKITAGLSEAEANYKIYRKKVADTVLLSPISGIIALKGVEAGEIIPQGQPLFAVVNIDMVKASVAVPEGEIGALRVDQAALVTVSALGNRTFKGRVKQISAVADPYTRTYTVKIDVANPDMVLRAGMIAIASIITDRKIDIFTIPGEAVLRTPENLTYVFVLDSLHNTVYRKRVVISRAWGKEVEVSSGLDESDRIVIGGQHKLTDGMRVTPVIERSLLK